VVRLRDVEWAHGAHLALAYTRRGARDLVAELFDVDPVDSPLRDSLIGIRFTAPATPTVARPPARTFQVDQAVHVHAYGNWRPGTVTKIGRSRVTVRYARNADGTPDERAFRTDQIQPADGVALVPLSKLRRGDIVARADGDDLTVERVGQGSRRYRTVTYTDGSQVEISAQTPDTGAYLTRRPTTARQTKPPARAPLGGAIAHTADRPTAPASRAPGGGPGSGRHTSSRCSLPDHVRSTLVSALVDAFAQRHPVAADRILAAATLGVLLLP